MGKKPFSGKKKRQQLKEKKRRKRGEVVDTKTETDKQPSKQPKIDHCSHFLRFINESDATVLENRALGREPFNFDSPIIPFDSSVYLKAESCPAIPRRPEGVTSMSKPQYLEAEKEVFDNFFQHVSPDLQTVNNKYCRFEINPEVYRQLWRVSERSNIILLVADARFPLAHLPASLFSYAAEYSLPVIVALNKSDLVPEHHCQAWASFLQAHYPGCRVIWLSALQEENQITRELIRISRSLTGIKAPAQMTIGIVGQPSVGKSAVLNWAMGKHLVSVKRTPGHSKHFQTHFMRLDAIIDNETDRSVRLCDSPGLVLPVAGAPRALQIVSGVFPLGRAREFSSPLRLLVEWVPGFLDAVMARVDIKVARTRLGIPDIEADTPENLLCLWAGMKGFLLKGGRSDIHRAGVHLFKEIVDGKIAYALPPPHISK
eukprot:gnl/Dysnectes_brevis/3152_a3928_1434.p1 GENE.gnl/Dysnectes_brevis/3152_a3928_1434~~gnl/Dysnectes_brevis/3152_a3928_1434.p1  ORF type:complete len:430 (-),score=43.34 gnl/Dysnectes_brevis/3152_a3928_1434:54-1343(-)